MDTRWLTASNCTFNLLFKNYKYSYVYITFLFYYGKMRSRLFGTSLALPTALAIYSYSPEELHVVTDHEENDQILRYEHLIARCDASSLPPEKTLAGSFQPLPARDNVWKGLSRDVRHFDVLVIGGGATGTGCALDAQTRCVSLYDMSRDAVIKYHVGFVVQGIEHIAGGKGRFCCWNIV